MPCPSIPLLILDCILTFSSPTLPTFPLLSWPAQQQKARGHPTKSHHVRQTSSVVPVTQWFPSRGPVSSLGFNAQPDSNFTDRKFGKHLQKRQLDIPEYAASFVNYKALKKVSCCAREARNAG